MPRTFVSVLPWLMLASLSFGCQEKRPSPEGAAVGTGSPAVADAQNNLQSKAADMTTTASVTREKLNAEADGQPLERFVLTNKNGLRAVVMNWGATLVSVEVPDRDGKLENIVCGFAEPRQFLKNPPYFGVVCGRYGNRIAKGKFTLDGKEHTLATNNGPNHLHGGVKGFDKQVWEAETISRPELGAVGVMLKYVSEDGEEGFPGTLISTVTYWLTDNNELRLDYSAVTDKATPINLTNHTYWNLKGGRPESGNVLDHELHLNCDTFIVVDAESIPTGELAAVKDTPFDFTIPKTIGADFDKLTNEPQGYDHCWVINGGGDPDKAPVLAAEAKEPSTGRIMRVLTTEPGVQFYTGNYLSGAPEVGGFEKQGGFCLETQKFPDSPNRPEFPSCILKPGETYRQTTVHVFDVE